MKARVSTLEQQILALVCSVFDAYTVTLFLPADSDSGEGEEYELAAYYSLGDSVVDDTRIRSGQGLVGWIVTRKKPLEVPTFDNQEATLYYYAAGEEETIKAFMGCPLPSGGALCVDSKRQYSFTAKENRHLQMFATILDSVHKVTAFDKQISDIPLFFAKLELLSELLSTYRNWGQFIVRYLQGVAEATGFDYCALATVEVPGESYAISAENQTVLVHNNEPFYQSMAYGLAGWVFRNGQTVIHTGEEGRAPELFGNSDNLPAFAAVVCMPIFVNKSARACLCLGHTQVHPVSRSMRAFLREAVILLSMHSEILYLHNRIRGSLASAKVCHEGPRRHDPDDEPYQPVLPEQE